MPSKKDRHDYVHTGLRGLPNRFHLCRIVAKGTRGIHTPDHRVADTMNKVLVMVGKGVDR